MDKQATLAATENPRAGLADLLDPGVIWLVVSAAGFGAMVIFAKLAYAAGMNLPTLLAGRFVLAAALLWLLVAARRGPLRPAGRRSRRRAWPGGWPRRGSTRSTSSRARG